MNDCELEMLARAGDTIILILAIAVIVAISAGWLS